MENEPGKVFREAWIAGVKKYYPGEPKPGMIAPWEETPDWERQSAAAVQQQVVDLIRARAGMASELTRQQKGHFVASCWNAQIYRHFENPKPSYVADWSAMQAWQQETDADIFEAVEKSVETATT